MIDKVIHRSSEVLGEWCATESSFGKLHSSLVNCYYYSDSSHYAIMLIFIICTCMYDLLESGGCAPRPLLDIRSTIRISFFEISGCTSYNIHSSINFVACLQTQNNPTNQDF